MPLQQIQIFTKDPIHHGKNSSQILSKFMAYIQTVSDPLNIFKYMQQKVICTFLPSFWLLKSDLLATMGDYSGCLQCLEVVATIRGICDEQSEKTINLELKYVDLLQQLKSEMKRCPINTKRSVEQFNLLTHSDQEQTGVEDAKTLKRLTQIYDQNYEGLKRTKQTQAMQKRQQFGRSWLYDIYQHQTLEQNKIMQKIRSNTMEGDTFDYHSLRTPPKKANHHKLTKTLDSVQIQKKKRKLPKSIKDQNQNVNQQQRYPQQDLQQNETNPISISVPVAKSLFEFKRRVTFGANHSEEVYKHKQNINKDLKICCLAKQQQKSLQSPIKLANQPTVNAE